MRKSRLAVSVATGALAAFALTGCNAQSETATDATLTIGVATPPVSLDTLKAAGGAPGTWYESPAYSGFLDRDKSGEYVGDLAETFGYVGEGNTEYEFTLREGLTFADGSPLTAKEAAASMTYFRDTTTGPTRGAYATLEFEAVDDLTVRITAEQPNPNIPSLLTAQSLGGAPISPDGIANETARANQTFGAGPYVLDAAETVDGDTYVYVPNENYWNQDAIEWDSIEFRVISNATQQVQALESGQIDAISADPSVGGTVEGDSIAEISAPSAVMNLYLMDRDGVLAPELADVKVRQALNFAIDRDAITSAAFGDYGAPTAQPMYDGGPDFGYDPTLDDLYPYDPERAKELLDEAGATGFAFNATYQSFSPSATKVAQAVASQLADVGVTLELKPEPDFGSWVNDLVGGEFASTFLTGGGNMHSQMEFAWLPTATMNTFGVSDDGANSGFEALSIAPEAELEDAAKALNRIIVEEALAVSISQIDSVYIFDSATVDVWYQGDTGTVAGPERWDRQ